MTKPSTPLNETRRKALDLLTRREHSELELHRKLLIKGHAISDIETTIQALRQEKLLSNTRFTECYIRHRREKGYGPLRIHAELIARGIPEDMIEHHLNIADNDWFAYAKKVWQKRFKNSVPRDLHERAKQMRFLQYRGFTTDHINTIYQSDIEHA